MHRARMLAVLCLSGLGAGVVSIGAAHAQPPPYAPIPAPRYEPIPPPPGSQFAWQPGHWQWNANQYVWNPGHYVRNYRARWAEGHWAWSPRQQRWVWVPPHWQ